MAHAPEPRPDAIRRARSGRARRAAQLAGGQGRALTSAAPQGRPQTHRACRRRTTPSAQLPYPARRPRHAHPQCRPPRARSPHRRSRHPHPDPAPRPRSARRYPHRVDRPHPPGLTISTACAQKRVKFGLGDYGFQPIVVFDAEGRFVTALLRPGKRPSGVEIRGFVRRLIGALRSHWPKVEILLRADSHYACPEVFDWCRKNRVDWIFGLAPNAALRRHVAALEKSTAARFKAAPGRSKVRRFAQFHDAAESWSRVERIIDRIVAGVEGSDTRFIVTSLEGGRAKHLYQRLYCARGQAENHIQARE